MATYIRLSMLILLLFFNFSVLPAQNQSRGEPLPRGFRDILLGTPMKEVKSVLKEDKYFRYRGDPDVSFVPLSEQRVIETRGYTFVDRGIFQFHEDRLYIISIMLNQESLDYYSMYDHLIKKYGEPDSLNPSLAVWSNEETRMSLERPLTVKYVDKEVFERLVDEAEAGESLETVSRENFINHF